MEAQVSDICVACEQPMPPVEACIEEVFNPSTGARRHIACEGKPLLVKVFEMNDCDWIAARSAEEAFAEYQSNYGGEGDETARELTAEEMQRLKFRDDDSEVLRTFQDELEMRIARKVAFPDFFASTEF